jgi:hypothetical protein
MITIGNKLRERAFDDENENFGYDDTDWKRARRCRKRIGRSWLETGL